MPRSERGSHKKRLKQRLYYRLVITQNNIDKNIDRMSWRLYTDGIEFVTATSG